MYCQACGAKNTEDARFCNMCGSSIAAVGSPGGPIAAPTQVGLGVPQGPDPKGVNIPLAHAATVHGPLVVAPGGGAPGGPSGGGAPSATATTPAKYALGPHTAELEGPSGYLPSAMNNTMSVSLEAIGVRSSRRTWAVIALASIGLVALGALGMRCSSGEAPVARGGAEPDDPFVIGTPVPEGEEAPGVDFVTGTNDSAATAPSGETGAATGAGGGSGAGARPGGSGTTPSTRGASSGGGGASSGSGTMVASAGGGSSSGASGGSASGMAATTGGSTSGSGSGASTGGAGSGATGGGSTGGDATGGGSAAGGGDTTPPGGGDSSAGGGDAPAERDIEMDMYAGRVRFLISRYYAARAATCFDRATRVDPSISGTVTIGMTIGADGSVSSARVARNSTGNADLGTCLQNEVRQWRLSPPPGGESVTMNMPFSR
ncbi:MAG: TonB family protein [Myxococcales bacterium]|nr:TonB family protein [Myxococcales bacterium]MCB9630008.1 TonB family protein [Sandaracinaceae bacterium]